MSYFDKYKQQLDEYFKSNLTDNYEKINAAFDDSRKEFLKTLYECREEILMALMAKYSLHPDECEQVVQGDRWFIRKKPSEQSDAELNSSVGASIAKQRLLDDIQYSLEKFNRHSSNYMGWERQNEIKRECLNAFKGFYDE